MDCGTANPAAAEPARAACYPPFHLRRTYFFLPDFASIGSACFPLQLSGIAHASWLFLSEFAARFPGTPSSATRLRSTSSCPARFHPEIAFQYVT